MTPEQLKFLQTEYRVSRDQKENSLHAAWMGILRDYQMADRDTLHRFLSEDQFDEEWQDWDLNTYDGRVPSVQIIVRKLVALLNLRNPYFAIDNENPSDEAVAWLLERDTVDLVNKLDMRTLIRQEILDAALFGTGIIKTGFTSEFQYDEEAFSDTLPRNLPGLNEELKLPFGTSTEYLNVSVQPGKPNAIVVSPFDIFFDPATRGVKTAARIYHRTSRRLLDIYRDARYRRDARSIVDSTTGNDGADNEQWMHDDELGRASKRADVIECFDLASRQYCVFNEATDIELIDWTNFGLKIHNPFHFFQPIPNPGSAFGFPYALLIANPARAIDTLNEETVESVSRDGKKVTIWDGGIFSPEDVDRLNNAENTEHLLMDSFGDGGIKDHFLELKFTGANPDLLRLREDIKGDRDWASGLTDATRNVDSKGRQTATEIASRQEQQGILIGEMRDIHEAFLEDVMGDLVRIRLQFWDHKELMKVVGSDPRLYFWVEIERARVQKDFVLSIFAGSTEKLDQATYRRQIIELLPRIMELKASADQEMMMQAQGMPPSPLPAMDILREVLDAFDPQLADRITQRKSPESVLQRLLSQHHAPPVDVSPELQQVILGRGAGTGIPGAVQPQQPQQPGQPQAGGASFEERTGNPAPGNPQGPAGAIPQVQPGFQAGRPQSEALGV